MQETLIVTPLAQVGEAIDRELGAKMVKDFHDNHPKEIKTYYIGKEIIEKILTQPNCVGIRFYNALNEDGAKTLVYVGIDENNDIISEIPLVDQSGIYQLKQGIVADRAITTADPNPPKITSWFE